MNLIKTLSAENLKGRSFSYDLSPVNVIIGDNEVGKTAVLDAVIMTLLGYKLKPGKPPLRSAAAIFRSCGCRGGGATELDLQAELTDGQTIHRNWTMKRGKISYTGPDAEWIPPLLLDPTGFFAISGPERRNHVLRQCDLAALGLGYGIFGAFLIAYAAYNTLSIRAALERNGPLPDDRWAIIVTTVAGLILAVVTILLVLVTL